MLHVTIGRTWNCPAVLGRFPAVVVTGGLCKAFAPQKCTHRLHTAVIPMGCNWDHNSPCVLIGAKSRLARHTQNPTHNGLARVSTRVCAMDCHAHCIANRGEAGSSLGENGRPPILLAMCPFSHTHRISPISAALVGMGANQSSGTN